MRTLLHVLKWLAAIVLSQIATALVTLQPLTGLVKLDGLSKIFIYATVPAWAFSIASFVAALGCIYLAPRLFRRRFLRRETNKLRFVPDAHNSGWSVRPNSQMQVRLAGTFIYQGKRDLILLKAFLKKTRPCADWIVELYAENTPRPIRLETLGLRPHMPVKACLSFEVKPLVRTPGKTYKGPIRFLDQYNRLVTTDASIKLRYLEKP